MPTYEYACEACGNEFEAFQSMSAAPIKKCPTCGKNKVQRKIGTGAGIIFKGGGFYETDYRGDAYKKAAEAEKSGGEAKPAETKTDAKPAAATSESPKPEVKAETPAPKPAAPAKPKATKAAKKSD